MSGVRYHRAVERDVAQALRYYEREVEGLGAAFVEEVNGAVQRAATMPLTGGLVRDTVRRQLVHRFPYAVLYRLEDEGIFILAVMHMHRRPDFWQRRLT